MPNPVDFLDLDEAVPTIKRTLKIKGQEYTLKEPDVADFAAETRRLEDMIRKTKEVAEADGEDRDVALNQVMLDMTIASIRQAFPDMPEDVVKKLTRRQIAAIREFIQAEIKEASEDAEDERGNVSAT